MLFSGVWPFFDLLTGCVLQPTRDDRGWFINPIGRNPWWTVIIALIPAILCTILIFMDQQITAVIINRKEHKLLVCLILNCPLQRMCVCDCTDHM